MDGEPVKSCTVLAAMADGPRDPHGRGPRAGRRARPGAAGLHRGARPAVRLLHAGHDADRAGAAGREPGPHRRRDPQGDLRPDLPLHRLHEHRARGPLGGRAPAAGGEAHGTTDDRHRAEERPIGFGRLKRKEDPRFIRGQGNYVDDVRLPACCTGRCCAARSRTRGSSRSTPPRAGASEGARGHHRRGPRGAGPRVDADDVLDTQAVLATDKVRFQGQEVAFVVADDGYSARDALELIDVEYEPLPAVVDPRRALEPTRRSSATTRRARPTTTSSTGRPATRRRPTPSSTRPTSS